MTNPTAIKRMRIAHTEELERVAREHPNLGISEDEARDLAMLAAVKILWDDLADENMWEAADWLRDNVVRLHQAGEPVADDA